MAKELIRAKDRIPIIEELYAGDLTVKEVSLKTGYTRRQIQCYLENHNLNRSRVEALTIAQRKGRLKQAQGSKSPHWKGGKIAHDGYVMAYALDHPRADKNRYVYEHILVWETVHLCSVPKGYVVHHLNGIKNDNRPENLIIMKHSQHIGQTEPYKQRIRALEIEIALLRKALTNNQLILREEVN